MAQWDAAVEGVRQQVVSAYQDLKALIDALGVQGTGHEQRLQALASEMKKANDNFNQLNTTVQQNGFTHNNLITGHSVDIDDLARRIKVLENEQRATSHIKSLENLTNRRDAKDVKMYNGGDQDFAVWKSDLEFFLEMNSQTCRNVLQWADDTEAAMITEGEFDEWCNLMNISAADATWAVDQLYFLLVFRCSGTSKDQVVNQSRAGRIRGALAWNQVKESAAGLTANRMAYLTNKCMNPTRVKTVDELPAALAAWERDMRELTRNGQSTSLNDAQKMLCIRALVPEFMKENLLNQNETYNDYEKLRQYVERQVALRRTVQPSAKPANSGARSAPAPATKGDPMEMRLGLDWWTELPTDAEGDATTQGGDGQWCHDLFAMKGGGKGKFPINGTCNHCGAWGHMKRDCPVLDQIMAQRRAAGKGDSKGAGSKGSVHVSKGGQGPPWSQSGPKGYGKSGYGKSFGKVGGHSPYFGNWKGYGKGGLNAVAGDSEMPIPNNGEDNSWIFSIAHCSPASTQNMFDALGEEEAVNEHEESNTPSVESWPAPTAKPSAKPKRSRKGAQWGPRVRKWVRPTMDLDVDARLAKSDQEEIVKVDVDVASLYPCMYSDSDDKDKIYHVDQGDSLWEELVAVVDSGAVDCVAPSAIASETPIEESPGSKIGQKYSTANGVRLPNQGQKRVTSVTADGQTLGMTYQIADVTKPLNSVGRICDKGKAVVFGAQGGYILDLHTLEKVKFTREQGVYLMRTWIPVGEGAPMPFHRQG